MYVHDSMVMSTYEEPIDHSLDLRDGDDTILVLIHFFEFLRDVSSVG